MYSWYADTSTELQYFFVYGNISVGYKGNFITVFTSMSLANIKTDIERAAFINETLNWIGITNETRVLLVDDDGNETIDQFYKAALNLLNITYDVYEVLPANTNGPNATVLSNYDLVIWFTGSVYNNTLTPIDMVNLETYLNNGGKLWIISQDLLEEIPWIVHLLGNIFTLSMLIQTIQCLQLSKLQTPNIDQVQFTMVCMEV